LRLQPFGPPRIDWVDAIVPLQSELGRSVARFGEAHRVKRPQAHPSRAAVQRESENPVFGPVVRDAQVKTTPVGVHAGPLRFVRLKDSELANCSRHLSPQSRPHLLRGLWRTTMNV